MSAASSRLLAFAPLLALLAAGVMFSFAVMRGAPARPSALIGHQAPPLTLQKLDGVTVPELTEQDLSGGTTVVNFWASWCAPCLVAMPHLIALQKDYGPLGLQVVGISMDDSAVPAKAVAARFAFNYPLLLGDARLGARFGGVLGLPEEILVGRNGKILKIWSGEVTPAELDRAIKTAIN